MSQPKMIFQRIAALVVWLMTIGLGIAEIYFIREIFLAVFARFSSDGQTAGFLAQILVVIAALVVVGFIVASTEYHRKHFCKHESWDVFAWTLVVELAIPFIAVFLA